MMNYNETKFTAEPGKPEIIITREFDALQDIVFKTYTDPKLLVEWLGPREMTTRIEKFEAKTEGAYRYIQTDKKGSRFAFRGIIHELLTPERIIQTFEYEGLPEKGHVSLQTILFEVTPDNRTRVTTQCLFQSLTDRNGMIDSGMEKGVIESHERLEELLKKINIEFSQQLIL